MLTIIRGLPGSGKSTLAKELVFGKANSVFFEADQFFMKDGVYAWDPKFIAHAHTWCQNQVEESLFYKMDVIVSNTFTTTKEIRPYLEINRDLQLPRPNVILCQNKYKSVHGVPDEVLTKMAARFQFDIEPLMAEFGYT